MVSFSDYLSKKSLSSDLVSIVKDIVGASQRIYEVLHHGVEGKTGVVNATGDEQVAMDVLSNDLLVDTCKKNKAVGLVGSEELEEPLAMDRGGYAVVFDPLDGSSLVDVNLTVGTIIGIFEGKNLLGKTGRDQIASLVIVYGPRLTFLVTFKDGVDGFLYDPEKGDFVLEHEKIQLKDFGSIMAPGNIKIIGTDPWYFELLEGMAKNGYALRYSGGMVPDVNQILLKGGGAYFYPGSQEKPNGKIRLLYESAPMALLVEQAGGRASNGRENILDIQITEYHQRTPLFIGSSNEILLVETRIKSL
ncbi:fructose-1,6-bisphosphatase [Candidatus Peregrinibacteria bacterium]|nr:fructose-1,6-bisphosphatase [Candidatus Peregrinibacteria bacterium]